ncbi:class I adenylate-forming enzyme family protein [Pendulispora albinea]|uniref:AMP-binding protein n=1 Tax=Pendulispora albinea TaxID=2741071 RepID=A0ABZ2LQD1_9BACT
MPMLRLHDLNELRERLVDVPGRIRVMATVANRTGLMWQLHASGVRTFVETLTGGAPNPSHLYRLHAANTPKRIALRWREQSLTFAEVEERLSRVAGSLLRRGLSRGSSMILMLKNRPEFVEAQNAATRLRAAAVSISWRSTAAELVYLATHSGAKFIFFNLELWPVVEEASRSLPGLPRSQFVAVGASAGEVPAGVTRYEDLLDAAPLDDSSVPVAGDDAAVVVYTSGTTGKPKGAVRKFPKDAFPAALRFIAQTPMRADDVHLVACPLYHSTAFAFLTLSQILGATAVLMDEFKPEWFLRDVERWGVTTTAVVPTMMHRVLALEPELLARYRTRTLRAIIVGGAPLPPLLGIRVMDHFGDILFNFYGATETGLVTLANPQDLRAAPGTIGRPVPGNEIKLLDDAGIEVARGEVGELYVKNKLLVAGYHKDEEATSASMREGFFSVGDLARKDRDGRYFIEGRKRDMIISGGVNVYPAEVESTLEAHPDVSEVAVVGVEDPEWGERVRAFIVRKPGTQLDDALLKTWSRERLAGPKVPRDFVFVDALPRNATGKVIKRDLRLWHA